MFTKALPGNYLQAPTEAPATFRALSKRENSVVMAAF